MYCVRQPSTCYARTADETIRWDHTLHVVRGWDPERRIGRRPWFNRIPRFRRRHNSVSCTNAFRVQIVWRLTNLICRFVFSKTDNFELGQNRWRELVRTSLVHRRIINTCAVFAAAAAATCWASLPYCAQRCRRVRRRVLSVIIDIHVPLRFSWESIDPDEPYVPVGAAIKRVIIQHIVWSATTKRIPGRREERVVDNASGSSLSLYNVISHT